MLYPLAKERNRI